MTFPVSGPPGRHAAGPGPKGLPLWCAGAALAAALALGACCEVELIAKIKAC